MLKRRRPAGLRLAALTMALAALAACGAAPQANQATAVPTAILNTTAAPAATAGAAPTAAAGTSYPGPDAALGGAGATAYPAPSPASQGTAGSTGSTGAMAPAPTPQPVEVTLVPTASSANSGSSADLPQGLVGEGLPLDRAQAAVADLTRRTGASPAQMTVVRAVEVEWPDGSLGCPQPGTMYTQVVTPGYQLVLEVAGVQYSYHAAQQGEFFLCENNRRP